MRVPVCCCTAVAAHVNGPRFGDGRESVDDCSNLQQSGTLS